MPRWEQKVKRVDVLLVERGLAASRTQARRLIEDGAVLRKNGLQWQVVSKPGLTLDPDWPLQIDPDERPAYVSRDGFKLSGALAQSGIDPTGWVVLGAGRSTCGLSGGLVRGGARQAVGADVV